MTTGVPKLFTSLKYSGSRWERTKRFRWSACIFSKLGWLAFHSCRVYSKQAVPLGSPFRLSNRGVRAPDDILCARRPVLVYASSRTAAQSKRKAVENYIWWKVTISDHRPRNHRSDNSLSAFLCSNGHGMSSRLLSWCYSKWSIWEVECAPFIERGESNLISPSIKPPTILLEGMDMFLELWAWGPADFWLIFLLSAPRTF